MNEQLENDLNRALYPEGFDASCGIPAHYMQLANAILCSMTGKRALNLPFLARTLLYMESMRWISLNDQMPEPETFVLTWDGKSASIDWWGGKRFRDGITHWMPFPRPPGETADSMYGMQSLGGNVTLPDAAQKELPLARPGRWRDGDDASETVAAPKFNVPQHWTFKDQHVAENFDQHVREQLPWYGLCTDIAVHVGRHYLTEGGLMYDLGASTGNVTRALASEIEKRNVRAISIDNAAEMQPLWRGVGKFEIADIREYSYEPFDFAVCFLTIMFLQPEEQRRLINTLVSKIKDGGALMIVDKTQSVGGYLGTVMHRLALAQKLQNGAPPADILTKELSLAGVQRPIHAGALLSRHNAVEVFRFGDFAGWVITG